MGKSVVSNERLLEVIEAYHAAGDNQSGAARALGIPRSTLQSHLEQAKRLGLVRERKGRLEALESEPWAQPKKGEVKRYLCTSAQDGTKVHKEFWANLMAMAKHYDAEVLVSTFHYNKDATGQASRSKGRELKAELPELGSFAPEVRPFVCNDRRDLAPRLTYCGELNIIPTAQQPLSGMETYTYRKSTIVPHTKLALKSVPAMKGEGVKLLYTTGAATMRNYIKRKEGFRAEHFHAYAALLVEVMHDGRWFCRTVEQGSDGTLCDLTLTFKAGRLANKNSRVANICWGDIHATKPDRETYDANWAGDGNMLDTLRPHSQHGHDLLDCGPFGHHTVRDPFENYRAYVHNDRKSIGSELRHTGAVAAELQRPWCRTVFVNSNHDRHLGRALAETDWRTDPENAETLLYLTGKVLAAIRTGDRSFNIIEDAIREFSPVPLECEFLPEDASDVILRHIDGGIECGVHGDRGANGAKGTARGIAKASRKVNMADKHAIEREGGVCVAGVSGNLDMGYNKGMSSWSHGNTVTYLNATRTIVSVYQGEWRA